MTADHLTSRQRGTEWWAQHNLSTTTGLHPDTTGPSAGSSAIFLPRCGQVGMPLVDKIARLYTEGGTPDKTKGVMLEAVYRTTVSGYNFFGGPWYRSIARIYGYYGFIVGIELAPLNDSAGDTQGRASMYVGDAGGAWSYTTNFIQRIAINDGQPHHLALVWPPSTGQVALYVDGTLVEVRTYGSNLADLATDSVYSSANAFFTHCAGDVSHVCASPAPTSDAEIKARTNFVYGMQPQNIPSRFTDQGKIMVWDATNNTWTPRISAYGNSAWNNPTIDKVIAPGAVASTVNIGGTDYQLLTYTTPGTFTLQANMELTDVDILVVGGGGQGGWWTSGGALYAGGGGGGGSVATSSAMTVDPGTYNITVGAGGNSGTGSSSLPGNNSSALGYTGYGGGAGVNNGSSANVNGASGGVRLGYVAGTSAYAYRGGAGHATYVYTASGGGGAGSNGAAVTSSTGSNGGSGVSSSITGTSVSYGGGGGGGSRYTGGSGGSGGGGAGATNGADAKAGVDGLGGGGGGAALGATGRGGAGGHGCVIIRYPLPPEMME